jgi:hypothetical protein
VVVTRFVSFLLIDAVGAVRLTLPDVVVVPEVLVPEEEPGAPKLTLPEVLLLPEEEPGAVKLIMFDEELLPEEPD